MGRRGGRRPGGVDSACVLRARVDSAEKLEMGLGRGSGSNAMRCNVLHGADGGGALTLSEGGGGAGVGFDRPTRIVLPGLDVGVGRRGRSTIHTPHSLHPSGGLGAGVGRPMRILLTGWEVCFSMFLSHSSMFLNDCSFVMSYTSKMPAIGGSGKRWGWGLCFRVEDSSNGELRYWFWRAVVEHCSTPAPAVSG